MIEDDALRSSVADLAETLDRLGYAPARPAPLRAKLHSSIPGGDGPPGHPRAMAPLAFALIPCEGEA